jgi:hypothetical protein
VLRVTLGPTQPPIQCVPRALSRGVKRPGREADHSPPSSAEVKNAWSYTSIPPLRLHGVVLSQAQGQLYLFAQSMVRLKSLLPAHLCLLSHWTKTWENLSKVQVQCLSLGNGKDSWSVGYLTILPVAMNGESGGTWKECGSNRDTVQSASASWTASNDKITWDIVKMKWRGLF